MLKIGGLFQITELIGRIIVWANTDPKNEDFISTLRKGDLFVVVTSDELYTEILVSKDGKRGFVAKLQKRCGLGWFEEVKVEEQ